MPIKLTDAVKNALLKEAAQSLKNREPNIVATSTEVLTAAEKDAKGKLWVTTDEGITHWLATPDDVLKWMAIHDSENFAAIAERRALRVERALIVEILKQELGK